MNTTSKSASKSTASVRPVEAGKKIRPPRVDGLELVVFFRSLSFLQGAGISLVSCFSSLAQSVGKCDLQVVCTDLARSVARGQTPSASLSKHSSVFSGFHVHLVKVGEQTGTLNRVLLHLAEYEESRERVMQRVRSALVYPTIVAILSLVGLLVLPPFVLRGIFETIRQSGVEPPLLTRLVMSTSSLLGSPFFWVALVVGLALARRPIAGAMATARWRPFLLSIPGLGRCLRCATSARFAGALSLCLRAGLNIQSSLTLSALASNDPLLQERIPQARKAIEGGATIAEGLKSIDYFTPLFLEMVVSGEEVGRTDQMMRWLAAQLEKDLEQDLQMFANLLEPIMLLAVGLVVGVLVIATATPMLSLVQSLG